MEQQMIGDLRQTEAGVAAAEICRKGGFLDATSTSGGEAALLASI